MSRKRCRDEEAETAATKAVLLGLPNELLQGIVQNIHGIDDLLKLRATCRQLKEAVAAAPTRFKLGSIQELAVALVTCPGAREVSIDHGSADWGKIGTFPTFEKLEKLSISKEKFVDKDQAEFCAEWVAQHDSLLEFSAKNIQFKGTVRFARVLKLRLYGCRIGDFRLPAGLTSLSIDSMAINDRMLDELENGLPSMKNLSKLHLSITPMNRLFECPPLSASLEQLTLCCTGFLPPNLDKLTKLQQLELCFRCQPDMQQWLPELRCLNELKLFCHHVSITGDMFVSIPQDLRHLYVFGDIDVDSVKTQLSRYAGRLCLEDWYLTFHLL
eukprot:TRINITY_DN874_c0_g1_i1.p1 TRINITY_DN874_c0_g1~~TRINITY_DN874_c0_g1_i1.p1  ORF type:complete len:328 (-),score=-25.00 TRINITY_DN874_c0_g1_i1:55-1038(-)